ncbi:MAG: hypothetical protein NC924_06440 [Candidatus Omnitrophica bacterium]|nr:hypothetical protein [Candidatus Omnitrophota bacterium]
MVWRKARDVVPGSNPRGSRYRGITAVLCWWCAAACAPLPGTARLPGTTIATPPLAEHIVAGIAAWERKSAGTFDRVRIIDTQFKERRGRTLIEHWTVQRGQKKILYTVELISSPDAGTQIKVLQPVDVQDILLAPGEAGIDARE